MNTDLSAFYFDIRKDALYCEPYSSAKRRAALETIEQIFRCTCAVAGAADVLHGRGGLARALSLGGGLGAPGDLSRRPGGRGATRRWPRSGRRSSACAASSPARWRSSGPPRRSARRWRRRRRCSSPIADLLAALEGVDLAEVCITSGIEVIAGAPPAGAFTLDDVAGVGVVPKPAEGNKCARSWRITKDVGSDPAFPGAVRARRRRRARVRRSEGASLAQP